MVGVIWNAGQRDRARRRGQRRRRRESAGCAVLAATRPEAAHREDGLHAAVRAYRSRRPCRGRCGAQEPLRALRIQELAQGRRRRASEDNRCGLGSRGCRAATRTAARRRRARIRNHLRSSRARPLARGNRAGGSRHLRYRDDEPRSHAGTHRRHLLRHRAGPRCVRAGRASLRRRTATAAAGCRPCAAQALARESSREKARAERQVRPARTRQPRHRARRRRARHHAAILRAGVASAARHGQPCLAPSRRQDAELCGGRRQGREPDCLRPGRGRPRHRVLGRGRRHHLAATPRAVPAHRRRRRAHVCL